MQSDPLGAMEDFESWQNVLYKRQFSRRCGSAPAIGYWPVLTACGPRVWPDATLPGRPRLTLTGWERTSASRQSPLNSSKLTPEATMATKFAAMHYVRFSGYSRIRARCSAV